MTASAFLVVAVFLGADPDPVFKRLVEDGKKQRTADLSDLDFKLKVLNAQVDAIKKAKPGPKGGDVSFTSTGSDKPGEVPKFGFSYSTPAQKTLTLRKYEGFVKEAEAKIKATKDAEWITPRLDCGNLTVGQVGIACVNDEKPVMFEAFQVIDKGNVIIKFSGALHWFKTDTKNMVDGKSYYLFQTVHVSGTKTYKTTVGTKTVLVLEVYTPPKKD